MANSPQEERAMVGLSGIPERFVSGLKDCERLLQLAEKVASKA